MHCDIPGSVRAQEMQLLLQTWLLGFGTLISQCFYGWMGLFGQGEQVAGKLPSLLQSFLVTSVFLYLSNTKALLTFSEMNDCC